MSALSSRIRSLSLAGCLIAWPLISVAASMPAAHLNGTAKPQGYLGIEFHDLTDDEAATLHMRGQHGATVVMVDHDGPAGKSGLRPHDVITAMNGQPIDSAVTLRHLIHDAGAGVAITLSVMRSGTPLTLNAKLASREDVERDATQSLMSAPPSAIIINGFIDAPAATPPADEPPAPHTSQSFLNSMLHSSPFTGLALEAMEPQLAGFFGAPAGAGLLVNTVMPNSPAANAGLRAGDIVLRANGVTLHAVSDWTRHLKASKGKPIGLAILRDKTEQTLTLTPDLKHKSSVAMPALWPVPETLAA